VLSWLVPYRVRRNVLEASELERLNQAVLNSPYLAETDLDHGFEQTYGFSMLFQRSQRERFYAVLPPAQPFFESIMDPKAQVFFVNPLIIHEGHGVAPHADKTLLSFLPREQKTPFPYRVSVLYLSLPPQLVGGELIFHRNALVKARFVPRVNWLIEFPGWLYHEVKPWKQVGWTSASAPRVSLVCEQYRLPPALLEWVPEFHLESRRPFHTFLEEAVTREEGEPSP
jgi:hypothetical protein